MRKCYSELFIQLFQETANAFLHFIYPFSDVGVAGLRVRVLVMMYSGLTLGRPIQLLMYVRRLALLCRAAIRKLRVTRGRHRLVLLWGKARRG